MSFCEYSASSAACSRSAFQAQEHGHEKENDESWCVGRTRCPMSPPAWLIR